MNRLVPYLVLFLAALWIGASWMYPKTDPGEFDLSAFNRIPVLAGGRIKPMDTVARTSLLILRGKQTLRLPEGGKLSASRWLADVLFHPAKADAYPVFAVANQEVLGMFGFPQADKKYCTYDELKPHLAKITEEGRLAADMESAKRTPFQAAIFNLGNSIQLYQRLKSSIHQEGTAGFGKEIDTYAKAVAAGAANPGDGSGALDSDRLALLRAAVSRYERQSQFSYLMVVAPPAGGGEDDWLTTGAALMRVKSPDQIPASVSALADMGDAFRANDPAKFSKVTREYAGLLNIEHPEWAGRTSYELRFNQMEPFYHSMVLYVGAFLLACLSWLVCPKGLRKTAFLLLLLALAVHSFGMFSRMYLQGRPPVTNLYSSAIFVGWGAVALGLVLEHLYRDGIGSASSGMVGFITLIIAHHLGSSGDTLEMMQAVLDSNIWLATHVVVITAGYSAMFLAGFLAIAYVVLGLFTRLLTRESARKLTGMVYGIVCFATLFSFVGTVLGGIWADQSWGRFWGWDPKENGALLIVLWCALILHARWGGFIRQRGIMAMAIFGNAITAFSWFGVNMLGVGLHSYGFMDKAFPWLVAFIIFQVVLILLTRLPSKCWRSFREALPRDVTAAGFECQKGA
ncbi:MAG: cytochrome c biogenesis protein CcsA [Luteolibacter sp.]|jgi:ABC-type transport system involved in cytochrome c biogenesis permease subunit|nr:cytochrome c biogenesis protein CcsA [Luteolibacter sp.]